MSTFPVVITTFDDQPNKPAPITDYSAQSVWWSPSSSKIYVYNGNWYALWITHPQPGDVNPQYYVRAWKSADNGVTWGLLDLNNSQKVNPFASPQNISVVRLGNILYVLYQYGLAGGSAEDYELRIGAFNLANETWGAAITGGPVNACQPDNTGGHKHCQDYGGVKLCMILDPTGAGFIVQYLSQGDLNPNVAFGNDDPYICSYVTCSFGGAWGIQVDFAIPLPQSETIPNDPTSYYGSTPQGLVAASSGRVHFFFSSLLSNTGEQNSYRIFECSLFNGVVSSYTLVADDVFPLNFGSTGIAPFTGDSITPVGYPIVNSDELLIPYISVFDVGGSNPFNPQTNTKVKVARAVSANNPSWTLQDVTTIANQGASPAGGFTSRTGGAAIVVEPNTPCIDVINGVLAIGWSRSVYTGGYPFAATNAAILYYALALGSGWNTPIIAFTTPENMALQFCRFSFIDSSHIGWVYAPVRDGEGIFTPPYLNTEFFSLAIEPTPPIAQGGMRLQIYDDGAGMYIFDAPLNSLLGSGSMDTGTGLIGGASGPFILPSPLPVTKPGLLTVQISNVNQPLNTGNNVPNSIDAFVALVFAVPKKCKGQLLQGGSEGFKNAKGILG